MLRWNREKQEFEIYSSKGKNKININSGDGLFIHSEGGVLKYKNY